MKSLKHRLSPLLFWISKAQNPNYFLFLLTIARVSASTFYILGVNLRFDMRFWDLIRVRQSTWLIEHVNQIEICHCSAIICGLPDFLYIPDIFPDGEIRTCWSGELYRCNASWRLRKFSYIYIYIYIKSLQATHYPLLTLALRVM